MPDDFIGKPEKVHRAIEAKKAFESVLAPEAVEVVEVVTEVPAETVFVLT